MKTQRPSFLDLQASLSSCALRACLLLGAAAPSASAFQIVHQFMPVQEVEQQMVSFQALDHGVTATKGHAGMLPLGMRPFASPGFPPALWGGWFNWTHEGALLTYASGTIGSTAIVDPSGAAIRDVRGAALLASGLDVMVDAANGDIFAVTLYSGLVFWTPSHLYLLLVGGPPTVYEVLFGGAPIAGVHGVARLAAHVVDMDPNPLVMASLLVSGALIYTDSKLILMTTSGTLATSEITLGGLSVPGVRGVLPMGGNAFVGSLPAAAYVWSADHVYQLVTGPGGSFTELFAPGGAPITRTWSMARLTERWSGSGTLLCAASIFTPDKQYFTNNFGPIPVQEVLDTLSTSIESDVSIGRRQAMLRQSNNLMEVAASYGKSAAAALAGTVIAGGQ